MTDLSSASALSAAVRIVRGESDLDALMPALTDNRLARVIACAPDAHPVAGAIAALCGGLPSLLDAPPRADPALHAALARLIGTSAGREALHAWAAVAPAGWGRAHAEALIDAVHANMCAAITAAALIGPGDASAGLLHASWDVAFAIRHWGLANPAAPTAWTEALSPAERDRLIATMRREPFQVASCLPWLPPDEAKQTRLDARNLNDALDAFVAASPTARAQHAAILPRLVARARPMHLDDLTRLACVMETKTVWRRVQTLIRESPDDAWRVVAEAPWDDLPQDVRAAILRRAAGSPICAAVAAARGRWDASMTDITWDTAVAFFAALDPAVWDALDVATQRRWRHALPGGESHLAVRSLGLRAAILARATLDDALVRAARRHARDERALRWALLPVALGSVGFVAPAAAHALIAALPLPPDPGAFFCIAGKRDDPDVRAPARSALRAPDDLALAIVMQRTTDDDTTMNARCTALRHALRGRARTDMEPIMPLLTDDARAVLMPDPDALVARLAHPDRRDALRQALDRLARFPPEVAVPTCVALTQVTPRDAPVAADALADALQAHGDLFLELADALTDDLRAAVLPLPEDAALADALRGLAQDDPVTARRLAHAFHTSSWRDALLALLHAPQTHAAAVWQAFDDDAQRAIGAVIGAAPSDAAPLAVHDSIAALALTALQSEHDDLRNAGHAALIARPDLVRAFWDRLSPDVQHILARRPTFADLPIVHARPVIQRGPRR